MTKMIQKAPAPAKAVILAAGFGSRMLPLSLDTPKPMMPLWGKPVLGHILDLLAGWGVAEVLINLHHEPDQVCNFLRQRSGVKPRIVLSFEPEILGTGGALQHAAWFLDDRPFWMVNADIAADLAPGPLIGEFYRSDAIAALWLQRTCGPRTVEMADNRITNFSSSRPGTEGTYTFCGLQLVSPRILKFIPSDGFSSIIAAYRRALNAARQVAGICVENSYWADIGTPESYLQAHRDILSAFLKRKPGARLLARAHFKAMQTWRRHIHLHGFLSAGRNVTIGKNAHVADAVIWDNARIASDAVVEQAVVGCGCDIHGRVPRIAVRSGFSMATAENKTDIPLAIAMQAMGWIASKTTVMPFEPRGSARHFTRLTSHGQNVILVRYSHEREENALYTRHAAFLQSIGLPVPRIVLDKPAKNFFVMEDLGDQSLQRLAKTWTPARRAAFYRAILSSIFHWHTTGARAARQRRLEMVAPFSADLYRWEREFFARHFLQARLHLPAQIAGNILSELAGVAGELLKAPSVLLHRDLQSSNILRARSRPFFIDFQGMRFGAAAYDLASLLCDPYVELPNALVHQLLEAYNQMSDRQYRVSARVFWLGAIERLAQALGAFGRLSADPETAWFGKYIAPGLRMMQRALEHSGSCPVLREALRHQSRTVGA